MFGKSPRRPVWFRGADWDSHGCSSKVLLLCRPAPSRIRQKPPISR